MIAVGKFLHEWIAGSPYFLGKDIGKHVAHLSMQSALSELCISAAPVLAMSLRTH